MAPRALTRALPVEFIGTAFLPAGVIGSVSGADFNPAVTAAAAALG